MNKRHWRSGMIKCLWSCKWRLFWSFYLSYLKPCRWNNCAFFKTCRHGHADCKAYLLRSGGSTQAHQQTLFTVPSIFVRGLWRTQEGINDVNWLCCKKSKQPALADWILLFITESIVKDFSPTVFMWRKGTDCVYCEPFVRFCLHYEDQMSPQG